MADQCFMVADQLFVSSAAQTRIGLLPFGDHLAAKDGVTIALAIAVSDALSIRDAASLRPSKHVSESLHLGDGASFRTHGATALGDHLVARDRMLLGQTEQFADALSSSDRAWISRALVIREHLLARDSATATRRISMHGAEGLRIRDKATVPSRTVVAEVL